MNEVPDAWDAGLNRLVEDEIARRVGDIRGGLIGEIGRAIFASDALVAADPYRLAEIAVDVMIEFSRRAQSGGNYAADGRA